MVYVNVDKQQQYLSIESNALVAFLHVYAVSADFTYMLPVCVFYTWNSSVGDSEGSSGRCASSGGVSPHMLSV